MWTDDHEVAYNCTDKWSIRTRSLEGGGWSNWSPLDFFGFKVLLLDWLQAFKWSYFSSFFLLFWPCSYYSYFCLEIPTFSYFFDSATSAVTPIEDNWGKIHLSDSTRFWPWRIGVHSAPPVQMAHTLPAMKRVTGRLETDHQYFFKDVPKTAKISNTQKIRKTMIYRKLKDLKSSFLRAWGESSTAFPTLSHSHSPWSAVWTSAHFDAVLGDRVGEKGQVAASIWCL